MDYFSALPEGCISHILSFTSPADVCRSAATSQGINLAADSDSVWEKFLPHDYKEIISRSVSPAVFPTKKQLYFSLSDSHIVIDDGNMSFGLEKRSGKKCYMVAARSLTIIWGNDRNYWRWISFPESRFAQVAQLKGVCWLEMKGRIDTRVLSDNTNYAAYLVYKIEQNSSRLDGFQLKPSVRFVHEGLNYDNDHENHSIVYLKRSSRYSQQPLDGRLPRNRSDGWKEIEIGEFFVSGDGDSGDVEMRLLGSEGYSWKSGLIVQGIEVRPQVTV